MAEVFGVLSREHNSNLKKIDVEKKTLFFYLQGAHGFPEKKVSQFGSAVGPAIANIYIYEQRALLYVCNMYNALVLHKKTSIHFKRNLYNP